MTSELDLDIEGLEILHERIGTWLNMINQYENGELDKPPFCIKWEGESVTITYNPYIPKDDEE